VTAASMALRDRIARGDVPPDAASQARRAFDALYAVGSYPEAWKLARLVRRMLGPHALDAAAYERAKAARRRCQYSPLMQVLLTVTG